MKKIVKLLNPVYAPNDKLLLPAGTIINDSVFDNLIESAENESFDTVKVMQHGTIAASLHRLCESAPYDVIFDHRSRSRSLFSILDRVELARPLVDIIDYFKDNDPYTYRHILIVFALSMLLAQEFMEDPYDLQTAAQACTTHDLGKFCVPVSVLRKTTLLGREEQNYLEHHSIAGYILMAYFFRDPQHPAAITARDHHERCDGSGYPCGIQLSHRIVEIVAVCDMFDALIAKRPYRPTGYDLRTALEEITEMAENGAIPWDIAKALISCNRKERTPVDQCIVSRERRGQPPEDNLYMGAGPRKACKNEDADSEQ